jgi:hypothetical protein
MRSRGALRLAAACCAVLATSAVVVAAQTGNATATAKPPRFDVQEVSTQLFLDIAGACAPECLRAALRSGVLAAARGLFARRSADERSAQRSHHVSVPLRRPRLQGCVARLLRGARHALIVLTRLSLQPLASRL